MKVLSEELLQRIVTGIVDAVRPTRVYLFGSHASGTPHADSDVDILVVVPDTAAGSQREIARRARQSLWGMCVPVELIVCTTSELRRWSRVGCNILHTVAQKGRLVYDTAG
jgi:uncharacterized protein